MRMSRVLLAGVAVAGAVATTSAFTAGNTITATTDDVAGYGELTVTGVTVSNIAYNPLTSDAAKLDNIVFTVGEDTTDMQALLTMTGASGTLGGGVQSCTSSTGGVAPFLITCEGADVLIKDITKVGLTVVSQ